MNSKYPRQNNYQNKIHIVKNKEIIIYTNGEESNRYHYSEVVEIPSEEAQPAVEHIQKKYSNFEVESKHTKFDPQKMDFDLESNDDFLQKNRKSTGIISNKNITENEFLEEEDKTEPQLKEFFKDVEEGWSMDQEAGIDTLIETKKLKNRIKTTEEQKFPIQNNYNRRNINNNIKEENVLLDIKEPDDEEESEESPQYIIEVESYTSPTFRKVDEKKAEKAVLNGIYCSQMVNGNEKTGIIFLGENQKLIFVCFEDKKETIIDLNYIKRIYFNIRGSVNMRNYTMKNNNERFMQFVQLNNIKLDFKFKNDDELELLIKGLYVAYKNKAPIIDKEIIYKNINRHFVMTSTNKKPENKNKYDYKVHHHEHIRNDSNYKSKNNYVISNSNTNKIKNLNYNEEEFEEEEENEEDINYEENKNNLNNNPEDDGILTTTVTEVFKNGKLINEETKQEYGGRITKLNCYSPDIKEYEEYLRKSKLRKSEDNLNKYTETEDNKYNNNYVQHINQ